jgi:hypothetical protein
MDCTVCVYGKGRMTLRIEKVSGAGRTIFRVSGRIGLEYLAELDSQLEGMGPGTVLDLEHVTLVDVEGVGFLSECEARGIELAHCSPYIREWIARERQR